MCGSLRIFESIRVVFLLFINKRKHFSSVEILSLNICRKYTAFLPATSGKGMGDKHKALPISKSQLYFHYACKAL